VEREFLLDAFERLSINFNVRVDEIIQGRTILFGLEHHVSSHGELHAIIVK
jgi:hypothetical protein